MTACLLAGLAGLTAGGAWSAGSPLTPRFIPGHCVQPPIPQQALKSARCGFLVVPENRHRPAGRRIRLAVAILPAVSPTPAADPVVILTGGPGETALGAADPAVDAGFNRDREVILIAQRGAAGDQPALICPGVSRLYARQVGLVYDAPSTGRLFINQRRACLRRTLATGAELSAYNSIENAADVADLRRALAIPEWDVYGGSYGTQLALTMMRYYPQGIRAVTLDGLVPPNLVSLSSFWVSAREGIDGVFRACAARRSCRARYPNIRSIFMRLVSRLEAHPVRTTVRLNGRRVRVVLDGGAFLNWMLRVISAGYDGRLAPFAIDALAHGNPQTVAKQWAATWIAPEIYPLMAWGMNYAVMCREWVPFSSPSQNLSAARRAFPTFPRSVLVNPPQAAWLQQSCPFWHVPKAPASYRQPTRSSIPTLVVSGGFDGKTGASFGPIVARTLSHATVITIPGVGHGVVFASRCAQTVMRSFFNTPHSPDTRCVASARPAPFETKPHPPPLPPNIPEVDT